MDILLLVVLAALLVFMFWNSRKRMKKQKEEAEAKRRQTVPGAEVLLQGGIFGTIVSYDPDDLDKPAEVEIAPGVVIRAHSQAIIRVIDPIEPELETEDDFADDDLDETYDDAPAIESIDPDADKKPGI
jgi:preprotein translocase subunit YajC